MEVNAVIFDLDGTLINTIEDIADANNKMLQEYGYPIHTVREYIGWIGNGVRALVEASLPPQKRNDNTLHYLKKHEQYYRNQLHKKSSLFPQMDKLLDLLTEKSIPIAINTNKPQYLTNVMVEFYLKKWIFTNVMVHHNHFPHKPNHKGVLHFAKQINCHPQNVLFIGDSIVDVQTAKAAGMIPIGVSWGYGNPDLGGTDVVMVDDPMQIIDYI